MIKACIRIALVAVAMLAVSGCRIDLNLDAKGGGTGVVAYRLQKEWQLPAQKKNLESADVKVTDAEIDKDRLATFKVSFGDVTKLGTTQMFKTLILTRTVQDGVVKLAGKVNAVNAVKLPDQGVDYFGPDVTITVTVPGDIVDSNAKSTAGKTATWVYPINDVLGAKDLPLTLSYKQGS